MQLINFNSQNFNGFEDNEEILLDTGVILAYLNKYDTWHLTIKNLFDNFIINNDNTTFLFINPCIINEVTYLSGKPIEQYISKHPQETIPKNEICVTKTNVSNTLETLIKNEVLLVLDGDKNSVLNQIKLSEKLGSADAVNASLANEYGINFLTVDRKLANNMKDVEEQLKDIPKVYYTDKNNKTY